MPTASCTTVTQVLSEPVTAVRQCNGSINGGGGTLRCSVRVTNNFVGVDLGSLGRDDEPVRRFGRRNHDRLRSLPGDHHRRSDHPVQRLGQRRHAGRADAARRPDGMSSAHRVTINQCNGSANGGGALGHLLGEDQQQRRGPTGGDRRWRWSDASPDRRDHDHRSGSVERGHLLVIGAIFLFAFVIVVRRSLRGVRTR